MELTSWKGLLCVIAVIGCGFTASTQAASDPIYTSRDQFTIPFRYDPARLGEIKVQSVQLFVSADQGNSWLQADSAEVTAAEFNYRPASDGEYWFSVCIQDEQGDLHPEPKKTPPGLKVVVDRTSPELELNIRRTDSGKVLLTWNVVEKTPEIESLSLEYRNRSDHEWKSVYIAKAKTGRTSWNFKPSDLPEVRGQIKDNAGNSGTAHVVLEQLKQPVLNGPQTASLSVPQTVTMESKVQMMPIISPQPKSSQKPGAISFVSEQNSPGFPKLEAPAEDQTPQLLNQTASVPQFPGQQQLPKFASRPVSIPAPDYVPENPQARTRHVNSHQFHIDYQIAGVGPSGVGVVELYITQDNGQQWWRYGVDADMKSPMQVKVPEDGRYGFYFRVHSGVGNAEPEPRAGQVPQVDVIVDSKAPQVAFLNSFQGHGEHINQTPIQWQFSDDHPTEKPLALYYSGTAQGPWQLIDGGIENSGSYTFPLPRHAPTRMFLRLLASDAAGNMSEAITAEPLLIDLARPTARVITVDPIR